MSLIKHAEEELARAGLFKEDSDYGGTIASAVMRAVKVWAEEDHSGMSHAFAFQIFEKLINFKPLTPLHKDDFIEVSENLYQCTRDSAKFTEDFVTWNDVNTKKEGTFNEQGHVVD